MAQDKKRAGHLAVRSHMSPLPRIFFFSLFFLLFFFFSLFFPMFPLLLTDFLVILVSVECVALGSALDSADPNGMLGSPGLSSDSPLSRLAFGQLRDLQPISALRTTASNPPRRQLQFCSVS